MISIPNHINHHIILIGFKSVGKSVIGEEAAKRLNKRFFDLDKELEQHYAFLHQESLQCRQIMMKHGDDYFRQLEHQALSNLMRGLRPSVIALGGGTLTYEQNQKLIRGHLIVHVITPPAITFERIVTEGRPAFFSKDEDFLSTFNRLWTQRETVYKQLAHLAIHNGGSINQAVDQLLLAHG